MITVYKYPLVMGTTHISLPRLHELLHVDEDVAVSNQLCVWIRLDDTESFIRTRSFLVIGTGHVAPHPANAVHVGSVRVPPFMWHVFADK